MRNVKESEPRSRTIRMCRNLPGRSEKLFPNCPAGREIQIAEHACRKYSGRVGRSAAAKSFDDDAISLAVAAHIRHRETNYDQLLGRMDRHDARAHVRQQVNELLNRWAAKE